MYGVSGLVMCPQIIDEKWEQRVIEIIDDSPWRTGPRRTQHYGFEYDYRARAVDSSARIGDLPAWVLDLSAIVNTALGREIAWQQAIVNEYQPGTGIGEHSDSRSFGPAVATISLASDTVMLFRPRYRAPEEEVVRVRLPRRSVALMTSAARTIWTHEILGRDVVSRRVSVTLRTVADTKVHKTKF